uniref:Double zinc ribbon and ankyrin repeat domains 1 n=1 Tax=Sinocyclocheilus grahami TaxID=75366 RepID=A0A672Q0M4_SINGR
MTAGSVAAPQIILVRLPPPGKAKHEIDSCTPVRDQVRVLYTLDGSKPEMMKMKRPGFGDSNLKYTEPVRIPAGKVSVRAMAVTFAISESRRALKGPRFLSQCLGPSSSARLTEQNMQNQSTDVENLLKTLTSAQISWIQRETDFLRWGIYSMFVFNIFITPVPPVPGQRLPPTEGGQMGLCLHCKAMVPLNTATCVVCESPLTQQLQPQASLRLQDKLICHSCGKGNLAHITHCVTCESQQLLQQTTRFLSGQRAAPVPSSQGKMVSCSKCNRVNHSDARFCDWCGAKPGHKVSSVTCSQCGVSSHPYANYCGGCGVFLDGPPRTPSHVNQGQDTQEADQAVPAPESTTELPAAGLRMCADAQTQTVGLFFPSSTELKKWSQQREAELSLLLQMFMWCVYDLGYWRKQLDHICAHLRTLIRELRLGRMISAVIQEDSYEVSLRINFISASPEGSRSSSAGQQSRSVASESQNLSAVTEGRNSASPGTDTYLFCCHDGLFPLTYWKNNLTYY